MLLSILTLSGGLLCYDFINAIIIIIFRPVRLAYQPPASSTFLSEQTSQQQPANSTFLSEQTSTSHQPPAIRTGCLCDLHLFIVIGIFWSLYITQLRDMHVFVIIDKRLLFLR
jgi:hypothetical protein